MFPLRNAKKEKKKMEDVGHFIVIVESDNTNTQTLHLDSLEPHV
jgi:hypothetical protein